MAGMTHVQYRNFLLAEIKSSYREWVSAKAKAEKYAASKRDQLSTEWEGPGNRLQMAFNELPEVKAGEHEMDAFCFGESLIKQPNNPEYLPGQRDFLELKA